LNPAVGSISGSGVYTAPASIARRCARSEGLIEAAKLVPCG
jgi:hypothetical protein